MTAKNITQDKNLALKLNKSREYPDRRALIALGHRCNAPKSDRVLECMDAGMKASLEANLDRVSAGLWDRIKKECRYNLISVNLNVPSL